MRLLRKISTILLVSLIAGCATQISDRGRMVRIAHPTDVSNCALMGRVIAKSRIPYLQVGVYSAENEALDQAAAAGATHVVWEKREGGFFSQVEGLMYQCR